jgi:hypothetical protein
MKLLIIGHSVEDHVDQSGIIQTKPGGIYYSAAALGNFKDPEDEIYLCTSVSEKITAYSKAFMKNLIQNTCSL